MNAKRNGARIIVAIVGIMLVCLFACAMYAVTTKSFPIESIDRALFNDVAFDYNQGTDAHGASSSTERLWFWEKPEPPSGITRDGYDLVKWQQSEDGAKLQAQWKLHVYSIAYDLDFGETDPAALANLPSSFTIESAPIELPEASRYAYSFDGWRIGDATERVGVVDFSTLREDVIVHACWQRLDFIVPETLYLGEQMTPVRYIYSIESEEAPSDTAGVWLGVANVDDGRPTYYIGHNPGVFTPVASFTEGSRFAICDDNNNLGVYQVEDIVTILYEGTVWTEGLEKRAMPKGEYASLQTCRGDKVFMDIYVSKRVDG